MKLLENFYFLNCTKTQVILSHPTPVSELKLKNFNNKN